MNGTVSEARSVNDRAYESFQCHTEIAKNDRTPIPTDRGPTNQALVKEIEAIQAQLEKQRLDLEEITLYAKKITKGTKAAFAKVKQELKKG